jgi:hypothetical protein
MSVPNKLECLLLEGFSSLVKWKPVRPEGYKLSNFKCAPLSGRLLALEQEGKAQEKTLQLIGSIHKLERK